MFRILALLLASAVLASAAPVTLNIGKLAGGAIGLVVGLVTAAAIGLREGSANRTGDKVLIGVAGIGGLPAGMLGGYYLGRVADREVTIIQIIPD